MDESGPIVYVDDDLVDVGNLERALVRLGIRNRLKAFPSAEAALAWLRGEGSAPASEPPRLLLLDLGLPAMGGLELLRTLKSDPGLRAIPAVILTSSDREADRRRARELGAVGYFEKPIDVDRFVEVAGLIPV